MGVSIGTGLLLETLFTPVNGVFDINRKYEKFDPNMYHKHYFNIYTLCRNILSSLPTEENALLLTHNSTPPEMIETVLSEIETIKNMYAETELEPVLFLPNYSEPMKNVKNAKEGSNTKKAYTQAIGVKVSNGLSKLVGKGMPIDVVSKTHKIPTTVKPSLITTHLALDLLNNSNVNQNGLHLLESHTGRLLTRKGFFKKYNHTQATTSPHLPMVEVLLYLFGDGELIPTAQHKIKKEAMLFAEKGGINPFTTNHVVIEKLKKSHLLYDTIKGFKYAY